METADNLRLLATTTLNNITLPDSNLSLNNFMIVNLADPTNAQDASTKNYVDQ